MPGRSHGVVVEVDVVVGFVEVVGTGQALHVAGHSCVNVAAKAPVHCAGVTALQSSTESSLPSQAGGLWRAATMDVLMTLASPAVRPDTEGLSWNSFWTLIACSWIVFELTPNLNGTIAFAELLERGVKTISSTLVANVVTKLSSFV